MTIKDYISEWFEDNRKSFGVVMAVIIEAIILYIVCNLMFGPIGTTIAVVIMFLKNTLLLSRRKRD